MSKAAVAGSGTMAMVVLKADDGEPPCHSSVDWFPDVKNILICGGTVADGAGVLHNHVSLDTALKSVAFEISTAL